MRRQPYSRVRDVVIREANIAITSARRGLNCHLSVRRRTGPRVLM